MKIAIYHGFYNLHFEMLGYIFEYFNSNNILLDIDIYSYINIFSYEWWSFYNKTFNIKLKWHIPLLYYYNQEKYDYVFLITDDDSSLILKEENKTKIISIEHIDYPRNKNAFIRIGTRFFINRPNINWALPCYKAINKNDKLLLLQNQSKINVLLVGKNQPNTIEELKNIFVNYYDINFHLVIRELKSDYNLLNENNIFLYVNCLTSIMLDLFKKSHYVLCFDKENIEHYTKQAISGAIHLSFTFGCKLILPESWNFYYNFKSSLTYDTIKSSLTLMKDTNLDLIYNEQL